MREAADKIRKWREDPVSFVRDNFHVEPDAWQVEGLRAFADPSRRRISAQACAGPGKSALLAWCGWNFLACYAEVGNHPNGAAMSVTSDNLKDNLWKEFSVWQGRSPFLSEAFTWTKERIFAKDHPSTWFISARSWSKKANPEEQGRTLSGLHSKYILYLIDESGDISPAVARSAEQGLSNCAWGKILQAGNPTSLDGMLHAAATTQRHMWYVIRITGDPDDPNRSPRINIDWAREQIKLYGRENPWVMSYILGLFPPASINSILGVDEVEAAMNRHAREDEFVWAQKRLGIDVARFGDDRTVLFPRQGLVSFLPVIMRHNPANDAPSVDIANRAMVAKQRWNWELAFMDDTVGWAHGAIDVLRSAGHAPMPVLFHGAAPDSRYENMRSYMWLEMASWIRRGGILPRIPELVRELTAPTYTFMRGKYLLEPKDQIKKRLGFSPDLADALALTFAIPDAPGTIEGVPEVMQPGYGKHVSEWDPYDPSRL